MLTKYGEIEESVEVAIDILSRAKMVHKTFNSDSVGLIMNVPVQLIEQVKLICIRDVLTGDIVYFSSITF